MQGSLTSTYVQKRFGQADRIKIGKKAYSTDLEEHYVLGVVTALEHILNVDARDQSQTKDDLLAEIHIQVVDYWNKFHRINPTITSKIGLQDILDKIYGKKEQSA